MSELSLSQLVFQAAKQILQDGQYPTIDLICEKLGKSSTEINNLLSETSVSQPQPQEQQKQQEVLDTFTLLARLSLNQEQEADITTTNNNNPETIPESNLQENEDHIPDHIAEMAARADRKAQYMAAGELVLTQKLYRYYRQTQHFSQTEVKQEVEAAMRETEEAWEDDIQNFSPAAMLKKYGK